MTKNKASNTFSIFPLKIQLQPFSPIHLLLLQNTDLNLTLKLHMKTKFARRIYGVNGKTRDVFDLRKGSQGYLNT